jgi:ubiquitin C-terminal hydrolase
MTCYLNSLLQTIFFIKNFRIAILLFATINVSQNEKDNNEKGIEIVK